MWPITLFVPAALAIVSYPRVDASHDVTLELPCGRYYLTRINQASLTGLTSAVALQTVAAGPSGDRIAVADVAGDNIGHLVLLRPS